MDQVVIREYRLTDHNMIMSTWLNGLYYGNEWFGLIDKQVYMKNHHAVIEGILKGSSCNIACSKDDEETIFGYAVMNKDKTVLHWVFVKPPFRNFGIMKMLVPSSIEAVTHLTKVGRSIKPTDLKFNPYLI